MQFYLYHGWRCVAILKVLSHVAVVNLSGFLQSHPLRNHGTKWPTAYPWKHSFAASERITFIARRDERNSVRATSTKEGWPLG